LTLGFDPARFPAEPPACYLASNRKHRTRHSTGGSRLSKTFQNGTKNRKVKGSGTLPQSKPRSRGERFPDYRARDSAIANVRTTPGSITCRSMMIDNRNVLFRGAGVRRRGVNHISLSSRSCSWLRAPGPLPAQQRPALTTTRSWPRKHQKGVARSSGKSQRCHLPAPTPRPRPAELSTQGLN